jgi:osmotically inducible protein OsmC
MPTTSRATTVWKGDLAKGMGAVTAESGVFQKVSVSWNQRAEDRSTGTSPEELLAAAHASCFSMAFAARLAKAGAVAARLETTAIVTFDRTEAGFRIVSSALEVHGTVASVDADAFTAIAEDAKDNCPVSLALKGNVRLSVTATLV